MEKYKSKFDKKKLDEQLANAIIYNLKDIINRFVTVHSHVEKSDIDKKKRISKIIKKILQLTLNVEQEISHDSGIKSVVDKFR